MLTALATLNLAMACAPSVAPPTLLAVARAESGLDPLAIGVNAPSHRNLHPTSNAQALAAARDLIAHGVDLDVGIAQLNIRTLTRLNMPIARAFEPCANLAAAGAMLSQGYRLARRREPDPQRALRVALSLYNTGDSARGWRNGYIRRVEAAAERTPTLSKIELSSRPENVGDAASVAPSSLEPSTNLDVFAAGGQAFLVWAAAAPSPNPPVPAKIRRPL